LQRFKGRKKKEKDRGALSSRRKRKCHLQERRAGKLPEGGYQSLKLGSGKGLLERRNN